MSALLDRVRELELATRPIQPETQAAMQRRWDELPAHAQTPAQTLGRNAVGCEGTHGVFPRCNLACTPCYHSRDANQVAVSGEHTVEKVTEQMALLRRQRGPRAHAQLIGGEVSLLSPDDHAKALLTMREYGREPMSMSHGDFDYDYLRSLILWPDGQRRVDRLSFSGHFDMLMFGRRGIKRPPDEASLNPYRKQFVNMFRRLRREYGVHYHVAHSMTVTPKNLGEIAGVIRDSRRYGFEMFSFQPAAFVGDDRRWHEDYRDASSEEVWEQIEAGVGTRLPYRALQVGDERCNRATYGYYLGDHYYPFLDDADPADLHVRDVYFRYMAGLNFEDRSVPLLAAKIARVLAAHPSLAVVLGRWAGRQVRRAGLGSFLRHRIRPVAYTMHSFMDAQDVKPAWEAMQRGETSTEPRLAATQERLKSCFYAMAHPETGELVPACVQHCVLDPTENIALRRLLPMHPAPKRRRTLPSDERPDGASYHAKEDH